MRTKLLQFFGCGKAAGAQVRVRPTTSGVTDVVCVCVCIRVCMSVCVCNIQFVAPIVRYVDLTKTMTGCLQSLRVSGCVFASVPHFILCV